ncbi:hypothetical protein SDC9_205784 [bioreactor metagenome]|uniref:Uncharacterized protein n=1 Tax=bioreactor metagenome TaxID=1076179 RepID=A0A645JEQ9_9ZZZZ
MIARCRARSPEPAPAISRWVSRNCSGWTAFCAASGWPSAMNTISGSDHSGAERQPRLPASCSATARSTPRPGTRSVRSWSSRSSTIRSMCGALARNVPISRRSGPQFSEQATPRVRRSRRIGRATGVACRSR